MNKPRVERPVNEKSNRQLEYLVQHLILRVVGIFTYSNRVGACI